MIKIRSVCNYQNSHKIKTMAKKDKISKPKRLSVKKSPVGPVSKSAKKPVARSRTRERVRARPWTKLENDSSSGESEKTLKWIITSADGIPIPEIVITLKGVKQKSSVSDNCGNFELSIPIDYKGILVFSWGGSETAELNIEALKTTPNIIISIKAISKYVNKVCSKNYRKRKRILI